MVEQGDKTPCPFIIKKMKTKNNNKSLFWHGVFAKLKIFLGTMLLVIGLFTLIFQVIVGVIIIILGIVLIFLGKQQRFDYKMKSGSIIHKGDW